MASRTKIFYHSRQRFPVPPASLRGGVGGRPSGVTTGARLPRLAGIGFSAGESAGVVRLRAPQFVGKFRELSRQHPFTISFAVCFGKGVIADLVAQKVVHKKEDVDLRRMAGMALFSGAYCGCAQHFVFNILFTRLLGAATTGVVAVKKMLLDVSVHAPFMYLAAYSVFIETLEFGVDANPLARWRRDVLDSMRAYVKVWPPVMLGLFTVVPTELRVSVLACVSFFWLVILSCVSHSDGQTKEHGESAPESQVAQTWRSGE